MGRALLAAERAPISRPPLLSDARCLPEVGPALQFWPILLLCSALFITSSRAHRMPISHRPPSSRAALRSRVTNESPLSPMFPSLRASSLADQVEASVLFLLLRYNYNRNKWNQERDL